MKKNLLGILGIIVGLVGGVMISIKVVVKPTIDELKKARELASKHMDLYMLMNDWVYVKQHGKNLADFFERNSYKKIAIYGMNYVGKTLVQELEGTGIDVVAGIDKAASDMVGNVKVYTPDNFSAEVDAVVVTPITYFDDIVDLMETKVNCPILSIEDVIFEMK